jgi:hypothetical protein
MSTDYIRLIQLPFYFLGFLILANSAQAACVGSDVVICSGSSSVAYTNSVSITSLTLETGGAITPAGDKGIINYANIGTLTNNGTVAGGAYYGIWNWNFSGGPIASIGTIINTGIIYGPWFGILNEIGTIGTITNTGAIYGSWTGGTGGIVIDATKGSLSVLNNLQGQGNAYGALNYAGKLPTNYNIIVNSPTIFGKLVVFNGSVGTTTFGIYPGSTVANGTYTAVLSGIGNSNLSALSGSYGSASWTLSPEAICTTNCI